MATRINSLIVLLSLIGTAACDMAEEHMDWDEQTGSEEDLAPEATQPNDPGTDLGEASQGLTHTSHWSWGTPGNSGKDLDLGSDKTQTCFLTGVEGSLRGGHKSTDKVSAMVVVFRRHGRWWLRTRAGRGQGALGHVRCISATKNRVHMTWTGNWQQPAWVPLKKDRHCFLTGVTATIGFTGKYNGTKTYVRVRKTGTDWRLQGYLEPRQDGGHGGTASAVCVDIPSKWSGLGSWFGPAKGSSEVNMGYDSGNMGCFLQGIAGNYYLSNPPYGWEDGVKIFHAPARAPGKSWWKVRARTGKGAYVECIQ